MMNDAEALQAIQKLCDDARARRLACRDSDGCPCSYKDCYEHGMWHNCTHSPLNAVEEILALTNKKETK